MKKSIVFVLFMVLLGSCGKKLVYFQEKEESKNKLERIQVAAKPNTGSHLIAPGDVLQIRINTGNQIFSEQLNSVSAGNGEQGIPAGILVNESGEIFLPQIGNIHVGGKTIDQATSGLRDTLSYFLTDYQLSLKLSGFRIFALGAVNSPGVKFISGDQATVLDAIGLCGDLSIYGKPSDIKIIREENGIKKTILLDVSDVDIFLSEGYYLQSNDIIYVETLPRQFVRENIQYINILASLGNLFTIIFINLRR